MCLSSWACCQSSYFHSHSKTCINLIISTVFKRLQCDSKGLWKTIFNLHFRLAANSVSFGVNKMMGFHGHIFMFLTGNNVGTLKSKWSWRVSPRVFIQLVFPAWPRQFGSLFKMLIWQLPGFCYRLCCFYVSMCILAESHKIFHGCLVCVFAPVCLRAISWECFTVKYPTAHRDKALALCFLCRVYRDHVWVPLTLPTQGSE